MGRIKNPETIDKKIAEYQQLKIQQEEITTEYKEKENELLKELGEKTAPLKEQSDKLLAEIENFGWENKDLIKSKDIEFTNGKITFRKGSVSFKIVGSEADAIKLIRNKHTDLRSLIVVKESINKSVAKTYIQQGDIADNIAKKLGFQLITGDETITVKPNTNT